jgi:Domain of unknown function (DUF4276)
LKITIVAKALTEELFVKHVLGPQLAKPGRSVGVTKVTTVAGAQGANAYADVVEQVRAHLAGDSDIVTTLLDYADAERSAWPSWEPSGHLSDPFQRASHIEAAMSHDIQDARFWPNLVVHEFEALLFSFPAAIADELQDPTKVAPLVAVAKGLPSPEHIERPGRALKTVLGVVYRPSFHGPSIAERIGLPRIRVSCPRFGAWLARLEAL